MFYTTSFLFSNKTIFIVTKNVKQSIKNIEENKISFNAFELLSIIFIFYFC